MNKQMHKPGSGRDARSQGNPYWMAKFFKVGLLVLALLAALALIWDALNISKRISGNASAQDQAAAVSNNIARIRANLDGKRYRSSNKRFSVVIPQAWRVEEDDNEGYFDVTFWGPKGLELDFLATPVDYTDFAILRREIEDKELDIGLNTHITEGEFQGRPAIFRTVNLKKNKLYAIDFLAKGVAHHLLFKAPRELFSDYLPVMKEVMGTYRVEDASRDGSEGEENRSKE